MCQRQVFLFNNKNVINVYINKYVTNREEAIRNNKKYNLFRRHMTYWVALIGLNQKPAYTAFTLQPSLILILSNTKEWPG